MNAIRFSDLKLMPSLLKAVGEMGYTRPSPIQEKAIPPVLEGRDLIGCAQTGTGKTAAFALPILQRLTKQPVRKPDGRPATAPRPIRALVLTPTRELALQIHESFEAYGRHTHLRSAVVFGGVSQIPQVEALQKGVDILVATPGRLNDLIGQGHIHLKNLAVFVLDEADRMLDMGFVHDVKKVISQLPAHRQSLLFSATMPDEIARLADTFLTDPVHVAVAPVSSTVDAIEQSVYFVDKANKSKLLVHVLRDAAIRSALVFTRTKHGADRVVRELGRAGIAALAIHGNKSQNARQNALNRFKSGTVRVLVATDIAARGIDIEELSHVINFDLPNVPETYVHRIGRTGRAGLNGTALSFCNIEEKAYLRDIEKLIRKSIPVVEEHPYPMQVLEIPPKTERQSRPNSQPTGAKPTGRSRPHKQGVNPAKFKEDRQNQTDRLKGSGHPKVSASAPTAPVPSSAQHRNNQNQKSRASGGPAAGPSGEKDKRPARTQPGSSTGNSSRKAKHGPGREAAITKKPRPIRPFQSRSAGTQRDFLPKDEDN